MLLPAQDVGDGANAKTSDMVSLRTRCRLCFSWFEQQFVCLLFEWRMVCAPATWFRWSLLGVDMRFRACTGRRGWPATWPSEFDNCTIILFCLGFEVEISPTRTRDASLVIYWV